MSVSLSGADKIQDNIMEAGRCPTKGRRPLRPVAMRNTNVCRSFSRQSTLIPVAVRPRSRSSNKELPNMLDKRSNISKLSSNNKVSVKNKTPPKYGNKPTNKKSDPIIVPITEKDLLDYSDAKFHQHPLPDNGLPDQETINVREKMELHDDVSESNMSQHNEEETSLKGSWQEKLTLYQKMKSELADRQNAIVDLYEKLFDTHKGMESLGQMTDLPPAEELQIMNLNEILPLMRNDRREIQLRTGNVTDINSLYNMPTSLLATCEETINKRQEIIEWFQTLTANQKKISLTALSMKIKEFNDENEELRRTLNKYKSEFITQLNATIDFYKQREDVIIDLQLRTEELTYEICEMNSLNINLRKQLQHSENMKSQNTRAKIETLEKELKEERCKRLIFKDKLNRTENTVATAKERIAQLETELQHAQAQVATQELSIKNVNEQNNKLHLDFNEELGKLTNLIYDNTQNLKEIADARNTLHNEKEDLEKRIEMISEHNEALTNELRSKLNESIEKNIVANQKYSQIVDEKTILDVKLKVLSTQLEEAHLRYNEASKQIKEHEAISDKFVETEKELASVKQNIERAEQDIEDFKSKVKERDEIINSLEQKLEELLKTEEKLKECIKSKDEYISQFESNQSVLKQQIEYSENKMASYEEQLTALKKHVKDLQVEFGQFENLNELHDMINEQQNKLLEATRQSGEVTDTVLKKESQIQRCKQKLTEQSSLLEEYKEIINTLTKKQNEQANVIKLLRNNLEIRVQTDRDLSQQLNEKSEEIQSLTSHVLTKNKQIARMEKVILNQGQQIHRMKTQSTMDEEKICMLKKKLNEYQLYWKTNKPSSKTSTEQLESFLQLFEQEILRNEPQNKIESKIKTKNTYGHNRCNDDGLIGFDCDKVSSACMPKAMMAMPAKIVMGNFIQKTYLPDTNDNHYKNDSLDRKKAITDINSHTWSSDWKENIKTLETSARSACISKDFFTEKMQILSSSQLQDEKKIKMLKFAGHKKF